MSTKHYPTAPEDKIPLSQKVAFGIGMLGNQMFPGALAIFMVVLVQALGMDPMLWGILFFLPRLVDALTDPIMGFYYGQHTFPLGPPSTIHFHWSYYCGSLIYRYVADL